MNPSQQRWLIIGGLTFVGLLIVLGIFWLTRPPATVVVSLSGTVISGDARDFFVRDAEPLDQALVLCSRDRLAVRAEIPGPAIKPGDKVELKGEYDAANCRVTAKSHEHYVRVTLPAPVAIELEGLVARTTRTGFVLRNVALLDGPQPCTLNDLSVVISSDQARVEDVHVNERVRVRGEYHTDTCRVEMTGRAHILERLPMPIRFQATVTQVAPNNELVLSSVRVTEGPQPCTTDQLRARVRPDRAAGLRGGETVEITGEYDPRECQVSVEQPAHSLALLTAPTIPIQPPVPQPPIPPTPPTTPIPPIPTPQPPGKLPFFLSGGVSMVGPVMAFRGSAGLALGGALKGMLSVGYGSGSIEKPELARPVTFTVIPVDFTLWYDLGNGLHLGGGAGVLVVQGPKPKFSNTIPAIHLAVGFALTDFLMLSGGITYVP
ncbi:hypothetical protein LM602_09405 [Candidatus Acetothermia bacterium]|jgi:hypothetical protein|nr:hypothetical protein [Candidatus Acetothermia bacterium]MCI2432736.1 hypothetical protein [Candidatus Acetothermia bacterium]MCI2436478.1 hypothetical protein [Candidatus Acetothermia bacterium]